MSFNFKRKCCIAEVCEQILRGWNGDPTSEGQGKGWKPASCSDFVVYTNKEMKKWVVRDPILKGQMVALEDIPKSY